MKEATKRIILIAAVLLASVACQPVPALPAETDSTPVESVQLPPVITADNADQLSVMYSATVGNGAVTTTWAADGASVWIVDGFSALLYDSITGEQIARFDPGEYAAIYDVSPDGRSAAFSEDGSEIILFDVIAGSDVLTITPDFPFSGVFFNGDGSILGASSLDEIKVVLWDTSSGAEKGSLSGFETAAPVYNASFGADGKTLLWFSRGTVQPMQIASQKMGPVLSHEDFVVSEEISPDGSVIATTAAGTVGGEFSPLLTLWNADNGEILRQVTMPDYFSSIAFSPDSGLLAAGTQRTILIVSVPHGDEVYRFDNGEAVIDLSFSPDGTRLITGGDAGTVTMYAVGE